MDSRNRLLRWLAAFEAAPPAVQQAEPALREVADPPLWQIGHAAWWQERWIARHVQRARGPAAAPGGVPLASIDPLADARWDGLQRGRAARWAAESRGEPPAEVLRGYLAATLDSTLELLEALPVETADAPLHFYRLALWQEDATVERLAEWAQALHLPAELQLPLRTEQPARATRQALWLPPQRAVVGAPREAAGFVPEAEQWAHAEELPPFEIDAQPVSWWQFAEFVQDGGYDERGWWTEAGWAWLQREGRRAPQHVEQLGEHGLLAHHGGRLLQLSPRQAACHVTAHEAEAWCRWADRRLPTEAEWEVAALALGARGFVFGDVWEWTLGRARPYPGHRAGVAPVLAGLPAEDERALRGGSAQTPARQRHPRARRFALPTTDLLFSGFRSCAL